MDDWIAITSDPSGTSFRIRQDNGYTLRIALWALGFVVVYYVFLFAGIKNVNPDGAFGFLPFLGILFGIAAFPLQFGLLFLLPFALLQKLWVKKRD